MKLLKIQCLNLKFEFPRTKPRTEMQVVSLGNNLRKQEGGSGESETGNEKTKCILLS